MQIKAGDVIAIREKSAKSPHFKAHLDSFGLNAPATWLEVDKDNYRTKMYAEPKREDIDIGLKNKWSSNFAANNSGLVPIFATVGWYGGYVWLKLKKPVILIALN